MNEYKPVFVTKQQIQFLIPLPMMGKGTNVKSRLKLHIKGEILTDTILIGFQIMQFQATAKAFTSSHVFQTRNSKCYNSIFT